MSAISRLAGLLGLVVLLALAGCASGPTHKGGYYQHDGPPDHSDVDFSKIPDAQPKDVPRSKNGNPTSYTALGKRYYVLKSAAGFTQTGRASWYGRQFDGGRTSSGKPYDMFAMTAAHKRLPIPSWVKVTNLNNGKQVVVKVNDRGPFHKGRIIDLSYAAAHRLGMIGKGSAPVRIRTVTPGTAGKHGSSNHRLAHNHPPAPLNSAQNPPAGPDKETAVADTSHTAARKQARTGQSASKRVTARAAPLQIGAFSTARRANHAKARAHAAGAGPVAVIPPSAGMQLYRVRVGPFDSSAAQRRARQELADAGLASHVVKHD